MSAFDLPKDFDELLKGIKWNRFIPPIVSVMQPILIFGVWVAFSRFDKRADAVSKLIAICEPIPTIDLNVPKPVVLASLFHSTDEALQILGDVLKFLKEIDIPNSEEIIEELKDQITDPIAEAVDEALPDNPAFKTALANCIMNAKESLGYGYWLFGPVWIESCMIQKGFKVTAKFIKDKYF